LKRHKGRKVKGREEGDGEWRSTEPPGGSIGAQERRRPMLTTHFPAQVIRRNGKKMRREGISDIWGAKREKDIGVRQISLNACGRLRKGG